MPLFLSVASISLILSLVGKFLADSFLQDRIAVIGSFAGLQYSLNPHIAFGIALPFHSEAIVVPLALLVVLAVALRSLKTGPSRVAFGLIIGGALGNMVDRLGDGAVTDFFQVGGFPIFNVADSCITIGVVILLGEMLFKAKAREGNRE